MSAKLTYNRTTGLVTGSFKMLTEAGKTVTAKFSGVLMPGWDDCSVCAEGDTLYEHPFASGTLTYKDNGATVSHPVTLTPITAGD